MYQSHRYRHHGEYLRDHYDTGALVRCEPLSCQEAIDLLAASPWKRENPQARQIDPMLNKGFAVVARDGDRCAIVNHHDGRYTFWTGSWAYFAAKYGLGETA